MIVGIYTSGLLEQYISEYSHPVYFSTDRIDEVCILTTKHHWDRLIHTEHVADISL